METYNTEEEQVEAIKEWWKENAVSLITGTVLAIAIIAGYRYWVENNKNQSQQASVIYSQILSSEKDKVKNAEILKSDYSGTPYAALAALLIAKDNVNSSDIETAILQLNWVVDNGGDDAIQHVAKRRLARLYLLQNNIEAAEKLVKSVKAEGFIAGYSEIRGDINLAKKLPVQAKENYRLALTSLKSGDQRYTIIKMKLDDLTQAKIKIVANGNKLNEVNLK